MTIDFRNFKFREATHSDASPTMGQFLNFVDSHKEWDDEKKKSHVLDHLSQSVLRWTKTNIKDYETLEWKSVKRKMIERFYVKLSIRQKVELRKELCQRLDESCQVKFSLKSYSLIPIISTLLIFVSAIILYYCRVLLIGIFWKINKGYF